MQQLTVALSRNADSALQANQLARAASGLAAKGGRCRRPGRDDHEGHQRQQQEDLRHHRPDRRHCLPDEHPGAECSGGGCACGRTRTGLRGRGQRSAQPGAAQQPDGARNQVAHQRQRRARRRGDGTGRPGGLDHDRRRELHSTRHRHRHGNQCRQRRATCRRGRGRASPLQDGSTARGKTPRWSKSARPLPNPSSSRRRRWRRLWPCFQ